MNLRGYRTASLARRLRHRVGFRGYFLISVAVIDIYIGLTFVQPADAVDQQINHYLADAVPFSSDDVAMWTWALAWWLVAAFCLVNAFKKERDHWGFGMGIAIKVAYVVSLYAATTNGMPGGWRRIVVWTFVCSSVWVMSRWQEPPRPITEIAREIEETAEIERIRDERNGHA